MVVKNIRNVIGGLFTVLGHILWVIFGLWGLYISFTIVEIVFDSQTAFFSLLFIPVLYIVAPLYALFEWGSLFPLFIGYGGGILAITCMHIGEWIIGED